MPDVFITEEDARMLLEVICRSRSRTELAARTRLTPAMISLMRHGQRRINAAVAAELGLRPVQGFVKLRKGR
jgi:hypothetical protein